MSEAIQEDLRSLVTDLIEHGGGLVDWPAVSDRGQAMMGTGLASGLPEGEMLNLSTEPDDGGVFVSLASDFLDTTQEWLEAVPRVGNVHLARAYLKGGDIGKAVERAFTWFHLPLLASGFFSRMDARHERDRRRLSEYYNALRRESGRKRARARGSTSPEQATAADRAVSLELERKLAELDERYTIHATLRPLVVIRTEIPILLVDLEVQRKRAVSRMAIYWNSLTKTFEPIRCTSCGRGFFSLAFTNDRVEALCPSCFPGRMRKLR